MLGIAHHGRSVVARRQSRWARAVRVVGVTVLCLAIAQPHMILPSGDETVVFLLDRSDSVSEAAATTQEQMLREALQSVLASARWSVVLFGAGRAPTDRWPSVIIAGDRHRSRRLGDGPRGSSSRRRSAAAIRRFAGVSCSPTWPRPTLRDDRPPASSRNRESSSTWSSYQVAEPDALVESVRLPTSVRQGDVVTATAHVRSNHAGEAVLRVAGIEEQVREIAVQLEPGSSRIEFDFVANGTGFLPITTTLDASFDQIPQNDTATGLTRVLGPARVALVEGVAGEGDELSKALAAGGVRVDVLGSIPSATGLLPYDAEVPVNILPQRRSPLRRSRRSSRIWDAASSSWAAISPSAWATTTRRRSRRSFRCLQTQTISSVVSRSPRRSSSIRRDRWPPAIVTDRGSTWPPKAGSTRPTYRGPARHWPSRLWTTWIEWVSLPSRPATTGCFPSPENRTRRRSTRALGTLFPQR